MDSTIKFNFLKFSEGNKESEKGKNNLLVNDSEINQEGDGSKFTLESNILEKSIVGEEEKVDSIIDLTKEDIKNLTMNKNKNENENENENKDKNKNENDLAVTPNNLNIENSEPFKVLSAKKVNDITGLHSPEIEFEKKNKNNEKDKTNLIDTINNKNISNKNNLEKKHLNENINNNQILNNTKNNETSFKSLFSNIKENNKVRGKSIFKNYINYTNKKKLKENLKLEKLVSANNLMVNINQTKTIVKLDSISLVASNDITNVEDTSKTDLLNKENNSNNEIHNIKEKSEKLSNVSTKDPGLSNFDRLKNILDIRNNDVNERLAHIFENNIKNNKNRFEIQLRPENLGKINVSLEIIGENVDININSDNINTVQSLLENNNNLQRMLQSQGMNLNSFNLNSNNNKNKEKEHNSSSKTDENKEVSKNNDTNKESDLKVRTDKLVYIKA